MLTKDRLIAPVEPRVSIEEAVEGVEWSLRQALSDRSFLRIQKQRVADFFGGYHCVFCRASGWKDELRWIWLVPISAGGDSVVGNMVVACWHCASRWDAIPRLERLAALAQEDEDPFPLEFADESNPDSSETGTITRLTAVHGEEEVEHISCEACGDTDVMRARVAGYAELFEYRPRAETERLTSEEQARLAELRARLLDLGRDARRFIDAYRARSGSE